MHLDGGDLLSQAVCRRITTLAISLPTVVGLAVWPWVRLSMGTSANVVRHLAQLRA